MPNDVTSMSTPALLQIARSQIEGTDPYAGNPNEASEDVMKRRAEAMAKYGGITAAGPTQTPRQQQEAKTQVARQIVNQPESGIGATLNRAADNLRFARDTLADERYRAAMQQRVQAIIDHPIRGRAGDTLVNALAGIAGSVPFIGKTITENDPWAVPLTRGGRLGRAAGSAAGMLSFFEVAGPELGTGMLLGDSYKNEGINGAARTASMLAMFSVGGQAFESAGLFAASKGMRQELARQLPRLGVGLGTFGIEKASGMPTDEALVTAAVFGAAHPAIQKDYIAKFGRKVTPESDAYLTDRVLLDSQMADSAIELRRMQAKQGMPDLGPRSTHQLSLSQFAELIKKPVEEAAPLHRAAIEKAIENKEYLPYEAIREYEGTPGFDKMLERYQAPSYETTYPYAIGDKVTIRQELKGSKKGEVSIESVDGEVVGIPGGTGKPAESLRIKTPDGKIQNVGVGDITPKSPGEGGTNEGMSKTQRQRGDSFQAPSGLSMRREVEASTQAAFDLQAKDVEAALAGNRPLYQTVLRDMASQKGLTRPTRETVANRLGVTHEQADLLIRAAYGEQASLALPLIVDEAAALRSSPAAEITSEMNAIRQRLQEKQKRGEEFTPEEARTWVELENQGEMRTSGYRDIEGELEYIGDMREPGYPTKHLFKDLRTKSVLTIKEGEDVVSKLIEKRRYEAEALKKTKAEDRIKAKEKAAREGWKVFAPYRTLMKIAGYPDIATRAFVEKYIEPPTRKALDRINAMLPDTVKYMLSNRLGQDEAFQRFFQKMKLDISKYNSEFDAISRSFVKEGATTDELMAFTALFNGEPKLWDALPAESRSRLQGVRDDWIDLSMRMTSEMRAVGLNPRETWDNVGNVWFPRFFEKNSGSWIGGRLFHFQQTTRPTSGEVARSRQQLTSRYVVRDQRGRPVKKKDGSTAAFDTMEEAKAWAGSDKPYKVKYYDTASRKYLQEEFASVKERADFIQNNGLEKRSKGELIDPTLRVYKFEERKYKISEPMSWEQLLANKLITDPRYIISKAGRTSGGLIAKLNFFTNFATRLQELEGRPVKKGEKELVNRVGGDDYILFQNAGLNIPKGAIKGNKKLGYLHANDLYIRKNVARDLRGLFGEKGILQMIASNSLERFLRAGVTYRYPFRHPKQFLENEFTMWFDDAELSSNVVFRTEAVVDYLKALRTGSKTELLKRFEEMGFPQTDYLGNELGPAGPSLAQLADISKSNSLSTNVKNLEQVLRSSGLRRLDELMKNAYHHEDLIYKWMAFKWRVERRGDSVEDAAKHVERSYFDWSNAPRFIQAMRFIPFTPSVYWQFSRIMGNRLRYKPVSTSLKIAAFSYVMDWAKQKGAEDMGFNPDDFRFGQIPLPWTDEYGKPIVLDARWLIPYNDMSLIPKNVKDAPQWIMNVLPMSLKGLGTAMNRKWYGGDIWYENDTQMEAAGKAMRELTYQYLPGIYGAYWGGLVENMNKTPDKQQPWWAQMAIRPATGVRTLSTGERKFNRERGRGGS